MMSKRDTEQKSTQTAVKPERLINRVKAKIDHIGQEHSLLQIAPITKNVLEKIRSTIINAKNIEQLQGLIEVFSDQDKKQLKNLIETAQSERNRKLSAKELSKEMEVLLEDEHVNSAISTYFQLTKRRVYLEIFKEQLEKINDHIKQVSSAKKQLDIELAAITENAKLGGNIDRLRYEAKLAYEAYFETNKQLQQQTLPGLAELMANAEKTIGILEKVAKQKRAFIDDSMTASIGEYRRQVNASPEMYIKQLEEKRIQVRGGYNNYQYALGDLVKASTPAAANVKAPASKELSFAKFEQQPAASNARVDAKEAANQLKEEVSAVEVSQLNDPEISASSEAATVVQEPAKQETKKSSSRLLRFFLSMLDVPSIGLSVIVETAITIGKAIAGAFKQGKNEKKDEPLISAEELEIPGSTKVIQEVVPSADDKGFREAVHAIENNDVLATNETVLASDVVKEADALVAEFDAEQSKEQAAYTRPVMTN